MKRNTKTSHRSRFKIEFDGETNCWNIHDSKYGDIIEISANRIETRRMAENLNSGSGFEDWQIPNFLQKKS